MVKAELSYNPYLQETEIRFNGLFIVKLKYRKVQNKNVGNCTYKM